jgi:hypothetical protein
MPPATLTLTATERRRIPFTHRNRRGPHSYAYENLLFTFLGFVVAAIPGAIYLLIRGL